MTTTKKTEPTRTRSGKHSTKTARAPTMSAEHTRGKNTHSTSFLVTLLIIVIVIAGFSLFIWLSRPPTDPYNDFSFVQREDELWSLTIALEDELEELLFHYHPRELQDIQVQRGIDQLVKKLSLRRMQEGTGRIYITLDPEGPAHLVIAFVEVVKVTSGVHNTYHIPTNAAYTRPYPVEDHLPVLTCDDASEDVLIIWIKTEGENVIATLNEHCIVLQGTSAQDTIRVADRFAYELLEIMVA